jgi:hypothetical protein
VVEISPHSEAPEFEGLAARSENSLVIVNGMPTISGNCSQCPDDVNSFSLGSRIGRIPVTDEVAVHLDRIQERPHGILWRKEADPSSLCRFNSMMVREGNRDHRLIGYGDPLIFR